jgi:hypothetical protein
MSICDCNVPHSLDFNFVQWLKQLTKKKTFLAADVIHPLDLNFVQQVNQLTQNEHY